MTTPSKVSFSVEDIRKAFKDAKAKAGWNTEQSEFAIEVTCELGRNLGLSYKDTLSLVMPNGNTA